MLTPTERITKLEEEVGELRAMFYIAGALPIFAVQSVVDQMVDEQILPAATRTEIFGRIRSGLSTIKAGSTELAMGASRALPRYTTQAEREDFKQREAQFRANLSAPEREILGLPPRKPDSGQ